MCRCLEITYWKQLFIFIRMSKNIFKLFHVWSFHRWKIGVHFKFCSLLSAGATWNRCQPWPYLWDFFLTICVSVASCERSFSKLKLIKSYLRSTMAQARLSSLAILSIEKTNTARLLIKNGCFWLVCFIPLILITNIIVSCSWL